MEEQYWGDQNKWNEPSDILWSFNRHRFTVGLPSDVRPADVNDFEVYSIKPEFYHPIPARSNINEMRSAIIAQHGVSIGGSIIQGNMRIAKATDGEAYYVGVYSYNKSDSIIADITTSLHYAGENVLISWTPNMGPITSSYGSSDDRNPNYHDGDVFDTIYPEQNLRSEEPGVEVAYTTVGVLVSVWPPVPLGFSDTLRLKVFDPDNSASGESDPNDIGGSKANDNYRGNGQSGNTTPTLLGLNAGGGLSSYWSFDDGKSDAGYSPSLTINVVAGTARVDSYFRVSNGQPGNNWIVAVHNEISVIDSLKFQDGKTLVRQPTASAAPELVFLNNVTQELVAERTLWIEVDAMPGPSEYYCNHFLNLSEDACAIGTLDPDTIVDFLGNYLTDTHIHPKVANYNARPLLAQFKQESGGDETQSGSPYIVNKSKDIRDAKSEKYFWTIQIVTAYETHFNSDGDGPDINFAQWFSDNTPNPYVGYSYRRDGTGPAVVYTEELRSLKDRSPIDMRDEPELTVIVAAHEVMHRFYGWHDAGPQANDNLMNGKKSMASPAFVGEHELGKTPLQFKYLQSRLFPL